MVTTREDDAVSLMESATAIVETAIRAVLFSVSDDPTMQDILEVGILLTDDENMRRLNRDYRAVDAPTDVLAFAMREGDDADLHPQLLGDIAISIPTAARQAVEAGHSLGAELSFLAVHGALHLFGYDHDSDDDIVVMEARETDIMAALTADAGWRILDESLSAGAEKQGNLWTTLL